MQKLNNAVKHPGDADGMANSVDLDYTAPSGALSSGPTLVAICPDIKILYGNTKEPGRVAQSVGHLTRKSGVLGLIPGLATYFCFSFR